MKVSTVNKAVIDSATSRVTLGFTGEDGDVEITVPMASIPILTAALIHDGELAVQVDADTVALAVACLTRIRAIHTRL